MPLAALCLALQTRGSSTATRPAERPMRTHVHRRRPLPAGVLLTVARPKRADDVDPWRLVSDALTWQ
jgi:hypothetical protein